MKSCIFLQVRLSFVPSVKPAPFNSASYSAIKPSMLIVKIAEILFHIFSFSMSVLRAGTFLNGKVHLFGKGFYH